MRPLSLRYDCRKAWRSVAAIALLIPVLVIMPRTSSAIQLHWSGGATDLSFSQNTRAVLVVEADSAESSLPAQWRLLWVADSAGIQLVVPDSLDACLTDTAKVSSFDLPTTRADSAAHMITARFCAGNLSAASAHYVFDLVGGTHGRFKVVALDPTDPDSSRVIVSNEVTYNGGAVGDFPPAILRVTRSHLSTQFRVEAVGVGLGGVPRVDIVAPDTSWRLPLTVTDRTTTSLTAVGRIAADLPTSVLAVGSQSGSMGVASLDADTASVLSVQPACVDFMKEINLITHEQIQPKDFALVASRDSFHVFYIRHDMNLSTDATEKIIGHERSRNLNDWFPTENTMTAISARTGTNLWDNFHVWAPTIIRKSNGDPTYYMLYTGVQLLNGQQIQRIGVATSFDLNIWTQDTTWAYSPDHAPSWAEADSTSYSGQQFRDPFVMAAVDTPGTYLLFVVGGSHARKPRMVVGVARSYGDLRVWNDRGPLWNTDATHSGAAVVESPHAFADPGGRWALYYTGYNFGAPNDSAFVSFETNNNTPSSPIDPDTTMWSTPDTLYKALGGDQILQFWHGSEYMNWAPGYEYLGAYDDDQHAVDIAEISWHSNHAFVLNDSCPPAVPSVGVDRGRGHLEFALHLLGARPSRVPVAFAVETPTKARVRLAVYDIFGRRVRTLLDEEIQPGRRELHWDGRGATGDAVGSGVYFARLTSLVGQRVSRVILLR